MPRPYNMLRTINLSISFSVPFNKEELPLFFVTIAIALTIGEMRTIIAKFATHASDMNIDRTIENITVAMPNLCQDFFTREYTTGLLHKHAENTKFLGR